MQIFAAHSESDATAAIAGIEELQDVSDPAGFEFFRIARAAGVSHASLVLKDSIPKTGTPLEEANPQFGEMIEAIAAFESQ